MHYDYRSLVMWCIVAIQPKNGNSLTRQASLALTVLLQQMNVCNPVKGSCVKRKTIIYVQSIHGGVPLSVARESIKPCLFIAARLVKIARRDAVSAAEIRRVAEIKRAAGSGRQRTANNYSLSAFLAFSSAFLYCSE